jgi:hypothetical protein
MIAILVLVTILSDPVLGEVDTDNSLVEYSYLELEDSQTNETEPQPVHLNLFGGDGGELRPEDPQGNSTTEVDCQGSPTARMAGYYIGTWTSTELIAPITIETQFSCSLWVYSTEGASNVYFNVEIYKNGNVVFTFLTDSQSVSTTPVEIRGDGSSESSIELQPGDTIGVRLAYFSDPKYFIGPGSDSILIVGGSEYNTHIAIITNPMSISVNEPQIAETYVTFSATYIDAFSSNNLMAHILVDGKTEVKTLSEPTFSPGNNGSLVTWTWDYKTDKAKDGEYRIRISVHYCHENDFPATGIYMIKFPKAEEDEGFLGSIGWILHPILLVIAIVAAIIIVRKILERRALKSPA